MYTYYMISYIYIYVDSIIIICMIIQYIFCIFSDAVYGNKRYLCIIKEIKSTVIKKMQ